MDYGAVILAGGKSSRMGMPKLQLRLNGVRFLDKLAYELSSFPELLVSVDDRDRHPEIQYPMVSDAVPGCGPMGGLYAALRECRSGALAAVPCDVPLFSKSIADRLCAGLDQETDAVIAVTKDGREHPLCGVYKKSCLEIFARQLKGRNYRMRDALALLQVKTCQMGNDSWRLQNINTPEEFHRLENGCYPGACPAGYPAESRDQKQAAYLAVSGWKNAGKTTLIEKLIPLLAAEGLKTAAVKHDGHSYQPDVPGTDSFRFFQAGACASLIFDNDKYTLTRRTGVGREQIPGFLPGADVFLPGADILLPGADILLPEADIFLLEGFKWSGYPKIEVIRRESGGSPIPGLRGRIAYAADTGLFQETKIQQHPLAGPQSRIYQGLPVLELGNAGEIAAFIMRAYESGKLVCKLPGCKPL